MTWLCMCRDCQIERYSAAGDDRGRLTRALTAQAWGVAMRPSQPVADMSRAHLSLAPRTPVVTRRRVAVETLRVIYEENEKTIDVALWGASHLAIGSSVGRMLIGGIPGALTGVLIAIPAAFATWGLMSVVGEAHRTARVRLGVDATSEDKPGMRYNPRNKHAYEGED